MNPKDDAAKLSEDGWDELYFGLIADLCEKHAARYQSQTQTLLKNKGFKVSVAGVDIKYKLSPLGCWFYTSENIDGHTGSGWTRMGWKKSVKRKRLPNFFAKSEAVVLLRQPD